MLIVGAGGFAKELFEVGVQADPDFDPVFFDDVSANVPGNFLGRFPILRTEVEVKSYFEDIDNRFAIGVGSPSGRSRLYERFCDLGGVPFSIISPKAIVGQTDNVIGKGTLILTNVIIESSNNIGTNVLIHVSSLVSHDVVIGDHCEISPFVSLLGSVDVGSRTSLGTGAIILPKVKIGSDVVVGAGAVVTKDVMDGKTVLGVPARDFVGQN